MGPQDNYTSWSVSELLFQHCTQHTDITYESYILSVILKRVFMLKCNLAMLRLTPLLTLLFLPLALSRLLCYHQRQRLRSTFTPTPEAVVLSCFPVAWFFGFLYYTEVPSLVFVVLTVAAATQDRHWLAALVRSVV